MKILGAHVIVYSKQADADRKFLAELFGTKGADAGGGWMIYALPPAEIAVHPGDEGNTHELYVMVDDVEAFVVAMKKKKVACDPVSDQRWGMLTSIALPSGGKLGVYQPKHASPIIKAKARPTSKKAASSRATTKRARSKRAR
jgi:hypothetical protein